MLLNGTVSANVGKLCARTCVAASKPEASLIKVGSLNADPKKLMPALVKNLEAFQYGDNQRWKATQRDVAALFTVCLGPHERDKGGKP